MYLLKNFWILATPFFVTSQIFASSNPLQAQTYYKIRAVIPGSERCTIRGQWVPRLPGVQGPPATWEERKHCTYDYRDICPYSGGWSANFDIYMRSGCKAFNNGDYNTALINFRRALNEQPNSQDAAVAVRETESQLYIEQLDREANARREREQRLIKQKAYRMLELERRWVKINCNSSSIYYRSNITQLNECGQIAQEIKQNRLPCSLAETNICKQVDVAWVGGYTYDVSPKPNPNRDLTLLNRLNLGLAIEAVMSANLNSSIEMMYDRLDAFLGAGYFQKADRQTWEILKQVGDLDGNFSFMNYDEADKLSCSHLMKIDTLWSDYSGGYYDKDKAKFGFSAQLRIIETVGETVESVSKSVWDHRRHNYQGFKRFASTVSWNRQYKKLNFTLDAPVGHLPWLIPITDDSPVIMAFLGLTVDILSRTDQCNL
jgi:hypothetical protein